MVGVDVPPAIEESARGETIRTIGCRWSRFAAPADSLIRRSRVARPSASIGMDWPNAGETAEASSEIPSNARQMLLSSIKDS
jgi:hypothetical protein